MKIILINFISTIFLSGTIGYISYSILQETADLYYNNREKEDKNAFIMLLSLMTFLIMFILYIILDNLFSNRPFIYFLSILMTCIIVGILDLYALPKLFKILSIKINNRRDSKYVANLMKNSKRNKYFQNSNSSFIYLFTLEGKYIASGNLISTTLESDMFQEYVLRSANNSSVRTIEEIEETYSTNSFEIFVDVENNIQIYKFIGENHS